MNAAGSYAYDGAGNSVTSSDPANGARTYTGNALNQYTAASGWGAPTHDTNGNITSFDGWTMSYDSAGRLTGVVNAGPTSALALGRDARNRIVQRTINGTTTAQVYDGWNLIAEYNSAGALQTTYIHGPQIDELLVKIDAASPVYYHHNALGSTVALTNAAGVVVETTTYDVFGAPTFRDSSGLSLPVSGFSNRFLYTGREYFAEVQLYDYRNRVYTAGLGRFLQTDPIRFDAGDVNLYRYVENNPVNWVDPSGLMGRRLPAKVSVDIPQLDECCVADARPYVEALLKCTTFKPHEDALEVCKCAAQHTPSLAILVCADRLEKEYLEVCFPEKKSL